MTVVAPTGTSLIVQTGGLNGNDEERLTSDTVPVAVSAPAVILDIRSATASPQQSAAGEDIAYDISGVNGWIYSINHEDLSRYAAKFGETAALKSHQGALDAIEAEVAGFTAYGFSQISATLPRDTFNPINDHSALTSLQDSKSSADVKAAAAPPRVPFSAAAAGADVALATLTSLLTQPGPAQPASSQLDVILQVPKTT